MKLRACNCCGWTHVGVTREYAEGEVAQFNEFLANSTPDVREMYDNKPASFAAYEHCGGCNGPHTDMRDFTAGDCPDGCTIGSIIMEDA